MGFRIVFVFCAVLGLSHLTQACAPVSAPHGHGHGAGSAARGAIHEGPVADTRTLVQFPEVMKQHTLSNMRDHLLALAQIQHALGSGDYDQAAEVSEQRLGMSSLKAHGAHESSSFMPKGMQDIGSGMHRSASRFALQARNASATGDLRPALTALAEVTRACVACHAAYRLQ